MLREVCGKQVLTDKKEIVCNSSLNSRAGSHLAHAKGNWWVKGDEDRVHSVHCDLSRTIPPHQLF